MTEFTEVCIPYRDLTRISLECKQCEAETAIDISKDKHRRVELNEREKPMKCPVCGADFDSQLRGAFSDLLNWYEKVEKSGHKVFFKIRRG